MKSSLSRRRKSGKKKQRRRSVPQRTCVGCRTVQPKREMVRIVRTPEGAIEIDSGGKRSGRGAYLCQQQSCWDKALKRGGLNHALKVTLDEDTKAALIAHAQTLPERIDYREKKDLDGG